MPAGARQGQVDPRPGSFNPWERLHWSRSEDKRENPVQLSDKYEALGCTFSSLRGSATLGFAGLEEA